MKTCLGKLEQQIMDIVWEEKNCSARDVIIRLEYKKRLAYTTIATVLQRLHEKGLVVRRIAKNGYIYSPKLSKEKYSKTIASSFIKNFTNSFGDSAIASFAEGIDKLPEAKRKYFLRLLNGYGKNK
jgi:predicted transcriptional regulator